MIIKQIILGDITIDVTLKNIKNLHLSVHPPTGTVRVSAPLRMDMDTIRVFLISKLGWIRKQQEKLQGQERRSPREYIDSESYQVWGSRYLLEVVERSGAPTVELKHHQILLGVHPGTDAHKRQAILEKWYRIQLRQALPPLISLWESRMGVKVEGVYIQRMKTRWGSCNPKRRTIRLNSELAKKPPAYLEYVIVHEMVHLLQPNHNERFKALMDRFLPHWKQIRSELNRSPLE